MHTHAHIHGAHKESPWCVLQWLEQEKELSCFSLHCQLKEEWAWCLDENVVHSLTLTVWSYIIWVVCWQTWSLDLSHGHHHFKTSLFSLEKHRFDIWRFAVEVHNKKMPCRWTNAERGRDPKSCPQSLFPSAFNNSFLLLSYSHVRWVHSHRFKFSSPLQVTWAISASWRCVPDRSADRTKGHTVQRFEASMSPAHFCTSHCKFMGHADCRRSCFAYYLSALEESAIAHRAVQWFVTWWTMHHIKGTRQLFYEWKHCWGYIEFQMTPPKKDPKKSFCQKNSLCC